MEMMWPKKLIICLHFRLDYCNVPYVGLTLQTVWMLQLLPSGYKLAFVPNSKCWSSSPSAHPHARKIFTCYVSTSQADVDCDVDVEGSLGPGYVAR